MKNLIKQYQNVHYKFHWHNQLLMFEYIKHYNDSQVQYSDVKVAHKEVQY